MTASLAPGQECLGVDLIDMRLIWDRDSGGVLLQHVGSEETKRPVWPLGYTAVAIDGVLKLTFTGDIVASEGDVFETMGVCGRVDGRVLVISFTLRPAEP